MKIKIGILLFITSLVSFAQTNDFLYKRELKEIQNQWHKVILPNELFSKASADLSDIRILGVTAKNDTIEAPYIINLSKEKTDVKKVNFDIINQSLTKKGRYFTFETDIEESINQINLDFVDKNFDWRVKLEASHDQQKWYAILDNYRIVSIQNSRTDYTYSKLNFPDSKYKYYRVFVNNRAKSYLKKATIHLKKEHTLKYQEYTSSKTVISESKKDKETRIDITLDTKVPVSAIKLQFKDQFDYYRPLHIEYLTDSIQTEKGWKYQYHSLTSGIISSFEGNEFTCSSTLVQKIRIRIQNHDNQPLQFDTAQVNGYIHELYARFTKPKASYFLMYGNPNMSKPQYDINYLAKNIPTTLITLQLGSEQLIDRTEATIVNPLFSNKNWLWATMAILIFILGWFSLSMIRNKETV